MTRSSESKNLKVSCYSLDRYTLFALAMCPAILITSSVQSNPTYLLSDISCVVITSHSILPLIFCYRKKQFVLRKKPAGQLLSKTAHQIEREYTMLAALHKHNTNPSTSPERRIPIPEPFVLCEDSTIIGTPFYVMEYLDGRIFTEVSMPDISPDERRKWYVVLLYSGFFFNLLNDWG